MGQQAEGFGSGDKGFDPPFLQIEQDHGTGLQEIPGQAVGTAAAFPGRGFQEQHAGSAAAPA